VPAGVRNLLRGSKDVALGFTVRTLLNTRLRGIGEIADLAVDTRKRAVRLQVTLVGETKPVEIQVRRYSLQHSGNDATLTVVDAAASRPWVDEALRTFVVGRSFVIPSTAVAVLKLLT
jgi:hypothetical protein